MSEYSLKVFTNKTLCGDLAYEDERYVFNYKNDAPSVVSLTMPIRKSSWNSKRLHPVFEMNMPEGALKEAIRNHFAKIDLIKKTSAYFSIFSYNSLSNNQPNLASNFYSIHDVN